MSDPSKKPKRATLFRLSHGCRQRLEAARLRTGKTMTRLVEECVAAQMDKKKEVVL